MSDTVSDISKRCASVPSLLYFAVQGRPAARHPPCPISMSRLPFAVVAHGHAWTLRAAEAAWPRLRKSFSANVKEGPGKARPLSIKISNHRGRGIGAPRRIRHRGRRIRAHFQSGRGCRRRVSARRSALLFAHRRCWHSRPQCGPLRSR